MRFDREFRWRIFFRFCGISLLCSLVGLGIGAAVAFRATKAKVERYAFHLIHYAETYMLEINTTLDKVNASPFEFCSDPDIALLRSLVFHGHLVKDIGRVRDGDIYCSAINGRFPVPIVQPKADLVTPSGRSIRLHSSLMREPGMFGDITQSGAADFVAASDAFAHLGEAPMIYTTTLTNRLTNEIVATAGAPLKMSNEEIFAEKEVWKGNTFYIARCSAQFAPCMVTGITIQDAWNLNSSLITGFLFLGGLAGVVLAFTVILKPHKRSLATQLRRAIRLNLITVVYQPIVDVKDGQILGVEALARWTDEDGEYVRPDIFVAAAEELGFIGRLTQAVLQLIVTELGDLLRSREDFQVNMNISAADLADPDFLPMLENTLQRYRIASKSIGLELTERSTTESQVAIPAISRLRARGHQFYIDDFGTGYSSLSYLNELAVDAIKIDRAFTDAIGTDSLTAVIVPQILAMANTLHLKVVVEGVERKEQSDYFANLDQKILAQGWHFGEPVPIKELLMLLESRVADKTAV
jgi:sensor c-di-GMP phosphodiesterase-like protein